MHFETTGNPNVLFVESTQAAGVGSFYRLTNDGRWRCSCPGYRFRRNCKHSNEAEVVFPRHRPAPARRVA